MFSQSNINEEKQLTKQAKYNHKEVGGDFMIILYIKLGKFTAYIKFSKHTP